jgi:hypothetical protein
MTSKIAWIFVSLLSLSCLSAPQTEFASVSGWENRLMRFETEGRVVEYRLLDGEVKEMRSISDAWEDSLFYQKEGNMILVEFALDGTKVPFGSIELSDESIIVTDSRSVVEAQGRYTPTILDFSQIEYFFVELLLEQTASVHGFLVEQQDRRLSANSALRSLIQRSPDEVIETSYNVKGPAGEETLQPLQRRSYFFRDGRLHSLRLEAYDPDSQSFESQQERELTLVRDENSIILQEAWGSITLSWETL